MAVVLVVLLAIGLYKIPPVDVPWHLATGRYALGHGHFPVTNTFSWTWPDHPLHQQYPLFQVPLVLLVELGWPAVTVVNALAWALGVLVWMAWAGKPRDLLAQPLLWLIVVMGVQRHHVARPEVWTLLGLGLLLLGLDGLRRREARAVLLVPLAQWLMVNGHQMWPLGFALQLSFLLHLGLVKTLGGRSGAGVTIDPTDRTLSPGPALLALLLSLGAAMISPLGPGVYAAPLTTLDTLLSQGQATATGAQAAELAPVWGDPLSTALLLVLLGVALGWVVRARRSVVPFELAVMAMGLVLVLAAIRGMPFCAVALGAVAARARARAEPLLPPESPVHGVAAAAAIVLGLGLLRVSLSAEPAYFQRQPGLGRSVGEWGEGVVAFLREDAPPGEPMNLGWVVGNPLIEGVFPAKRVFVDPRWEAYPRAFLLDAIRSLQDPDMLQALIERHQPGFLVAEMRLPEVQQRASELWATGQWALVYADPEHLVLVHLTPESSAYLARHPPLQPRELVERMSWQEDHPILRAQEQIRVARLLRWLGAPEPAQVLLEQAQGRADHPRVQQDLATMP
jgi:hypothetical protein